MEDTEMTVGEDGRIACAGAGTASSSDNDTLARREMRIRLWAGWAIVGLSCGIAYAASTYSAFLWPVAALAAWFGAYQTVYSVGCRQGDGTSETETSTQLNPMQRRQRLRMGLGFLAATLVLGRLAALGVALALLWPLAGIAFWFGTSFLVAARTRYQGCPEVGAIPSLLLGRRVATRCPLLERFDR